MADIEKSFKNDFSTCSFHSFFCIFCFYLCSQGEGYHQHFQESSPSPAGGFGQGVATVFSAPMYSAHRNRGGVLVVRGGGDGTIDALGYDAAPEPALVNRSVIATFGAILILYEVYYYFVLQFYFCTLIDRSIMYFTPTTT